MNWNYVCWIEALQHEVMRVQREALSVALGQQWLVQLQECSAYHSIRKKPTTAKINPAAPTNILWDREAILPVEVNRKAR